jgi:hypothetical protein
VAKAKTVSEVGAESGRNTVQLLRWAADHRAVVHVVEPKPLFDVDALERQYSRFFVMHQAVSLDALPNIARPDVVLLDGDHNWYTVIEELRVLDRVSSGWPITFLHDIDWPYGRRDMYYDPDAIPAACRQPFKRSGIVRGASALTPGGTNAEYANAAHDGGPRNGVLTAVENFMDETQRALELFLVRGPDGLAILVDRGHLKGKVGRLVQQLHDHDFGLELSPRYASRFFV